MNYRILHTEYNYKTSTWDVIENNKVLRTFKREMNANNYELKLNELHYKNVWKTN